MATLGRLHVWDNSKSWSVWCRRIRAHAIGSGRTEVRGQFDLLPGKDEQMAAVVNEVRAYSLDRKNKFFYLHLLREDWWVRHLISGPSSEMVDIEQGLRVDPPEWAQRGRA